VAIFLRAAILPCSRGDIVGHAAWAKGNQNTGNVMTAVQLPRRLRAKAGYTLIEVLIVLAIIALLVALVGPRLFSLYDKAKAQTTTTEITTLKTALDTMQIDIGRYPSEQEGLNLLVQAPGQGVANWSGPYLSSAEVPKDKWGNPYLYVPAPEGGQPQVGSYGADGKAGGSGTATDIIK
jgi:general secretion pathway protein G